MATALNDKASVFLRVRDRLPEPDPLVKKAIGEIEEEYKRRTGLWPKRIPSTATTHSPRRKIASADSSHPTPTDSVDEFLGLLRERGIGTSILKLSKSLDQSRLDETTRLLLATPHVYATTLLRLLESKHAQAGDVEGLREQVKVEIDGTPRERFYEELRDAFIDANSLSLKSDRKTAFAAELVARGVPLTVGKTTPAMRAILAEVQSEGTLRSWVDEFVDRGEIDKSRFTEAVKEAMVDYLESIGIQQAKITNDNFKAGKFDEYFGQAYHQAIFGRNGKGIPLPEPVLAAASEFRLPTYEFLDEQGVVSASIHAAAVLYQMYFIGDKLGLFEMPNALLLRRAHGTLDLPSGPGSQLLQAYKRLQRNDYLPPEERMLLYKRVFNLGSGKVLENTGVNAEFPDVWGVLASEVTKYITKEESSDVAEERISRAAIEEAIQNLQSNLSFYAADIDEDVRVMQEQYQLAEKVLADDQIMASIGLVRRRTLQAAIERLVAEDSGAAPMVSKLFKLGTKGQEILHFVADYDSSGPEEEFRTFLRLMEAWIVARGSLQDDDLEQPEQEAESEDEFDEYGSDESAQQEADW